MPPPPARPLRLPDQLKDLQILEAAGRLGSTTPDQVVSLMTGQIPSEISTVDAIRMQERTAKLVRQGLLESTLTFTSRKPLRSTERYLYRLTERGLSFAATLAGRKWRAVNAVAVNADPQLDGWADEEVVWRESYPNFSGRYHFRSALNVVVKDAFLERKSALEPLTEPGYVQVIQLTKDGRDRLDAHFFSQSISTPLFPRPARQDQVVHHLMTVHVALHLLSFFQGELIVLRGEWIPRGVRAASVGMEPEAQGRVSGARSGGMVGWVTGMCGWAPKSQGRHGVGAWLGVLDFDVR